LGTRPWLRFVGLRIGRGGRSRLAARHFPGGPVGPPSRWAAMSNVKVGHSEKERKGVIGTGEGAEGPYLKREGSIWIFVQGPPSSYGYATADRAGLPT